MIESKAYLCISVRCSGWIWTAFEKMVLGSLKRLKTQLEGSGGVFDLAMKGFVWSERSSRHDLTIFN